MKVNHDGLIISSIFSVFVVFLVLLRPASALNINLWYVSLGYDGSLNITYTADKSGTGQIKWGYTYWTGNDFLGTFSSTPVPNTSDKYQVQLKGLAAGNDIYYLINHGGIDDPAGLRVITFPGTKTVDKNPPMYINGIGIQNITSGGATIRFTAPGGDGRYNNQERGQVVSRYFVAHKTGSYSMNNKADCLSATPVADLPTPTQPGSIQSFTLSGLNPSTDYTVCLISYDAAGNETSGYSPFADKPFSISTTSFTTAPAPDAAPPSAITSLQVVSTSNNSATLSWVIPSDNVAVTRYEIHLKPNTTASMTDSDWAGGNIIYPPVLSGEAGATQTFTVPNLTQGTSYAFGIKAFDAAGNVTPLASINFTAITATTPASAVPSSPATPSAGTPPTNNSPSSTTQPQATGSTGTAQTPAPVITPPPSSKTTTLKIVVRDPKGEPVNGAYLELSSSAGTTQTFNGSTYIEGDYTFSSLALATYGLKVSPPFGREELNPLSGYPVLLTDPTFNSREIILSFRNGLRSNTPKAGNPFAATGGATICGTIYSPDKKTVPWVTVWIAVQGSGGKFGLGKSLWSDSAGKYCYNNLSAGSYGLGAIGPANRPDLSVPLITSLTLATDSRLTYDFIFFKPLVIKNGQTMIQPEPSEPVPLNLSAAEQCVRSLVGESRYKQIHDNNSKPTSAEVTLLNPCYKLIDVAPVAGGGGSQSQLSGPVFILPVALDKSSGSSGKAPATGPATCDSAAFLAANDDVNKLGAQVDDISHEVDRLRKTNFKVPAALSVLLESVRASINSFGDAKSCGEALAGAGDLPGIIAQLPNSLDDVFKLKVATRLSANFDVATQQYVLSVQTSLKKLQKTGYDVKGFTRQLNDSRADLLTCRNQAQANFKNNDSIGALETLGKCFDKLDKFRETQYLMSMLAGPRTFLVSKVNALTKHAVDGTVSLNEDSAQPIKAGAATLLRDMEDVFKNLSALEKDSKKMLMAIGFLAKQFNDLNSLVEKFIDGSPLQKAKNAEQSIEAPVLPPSVAAFFKTN
ncbi:fibronectin type III domain-containing protein [Candidatus Uhrbacteria bacterium]|nr:fibronectin type III domain-containing protein [Candidatus Uhrbacteria bacterium]